MDEARLPGTVHARPERPAPQRSEPVRTCVGCRTRSAAAGLLRVVAVDGTLVPDPRRRHPGRGAWVHPDPGCLRAAERRRAFPRALRSAGPLDAGPVHALLAQEPGPPLPAPPPATGGPTPHHTGPRPGAPSDEDAPGAGSEGSRSTEMRQQP